MKKLFSFFLILFIGSFSFSQIPETDSLPANPSPRKIALVLSGGGARGLAHLGVIRALDEIGLRPHVVVGSSIGAVIGAMYACGYPVPQIIENIRGINFDHLFIQEAYRENVFASQKFEELPPVIRLRFDRKQGLHFPSNLLPTQKLFELYFRQTVAPEFYAGGNFDKLDIPYRVVATDIKTGQSVTLDRGNLAKALIGSSAVPLVFEPVKYGNYLLVDGGITNNIPADIAKDMGADFIIAVDITSHVQPITDIANPIELFNQSLNVLSVHSDTKNLKLVDLLIHPELGDISSADYQKIDSLITLGYQGAMTKRADLEKRVVDSKPSTPYWQLADSTLRQMTITDIRVRGLKRLRSYLVTSEIELKKGKPWDYQKAVKSLRNLFSTNYFDYVTMNVEKKTPTTAELVVDVDEKLSKAIALGAFYDNQRRLRAFAEVKNESFFGQAIYYHIAGIVGDQMRGIRFLTGNPRLFTTPFTGFHKIQFMNENIPLYRQGGFIAFGKYNRLEINTNFGIQVRRLGLTSVGWKRVWMDPTTFADSTRFKPISGRPYDLSALTFRIFADNTDDIDFPTRGRQNHFILERALEQLGSDFDYIQASYKSKIHYSLSSRRVLSFMIYATYANWTLPFYSNFNFGGEDHMMGYYEGEKWGQNFITFGLRYRQKITQTIYWFGQVNTGKEFSNYHKIDWTHQINGFGLGVVAQSLLGPFSLSYGYSSPTHQLLYLSIGHNF